MKTTKLTSLILLSSQLAFSALAIINPGFETGNFTGWTQSDPTRSAVVTTYTATQSTGQPTDGRVYTPSQVLHPFEDDQSVAPGGNYFARLRAGPKNVFTTISQTFVLDRGYALVGVAAFDALGGSAANDTANLSISSSFGGEILWSRDVSTVNSEYGLGKSSPWEIWTYYAPGYTAYTLTFQVKNVGSSLNSSVALLDAIQIVHVPDNSSTLLLLGSGLLGMVFCQRRLQSTRPQANESWARAMVARNASIA